MKFTNYIYIFIASLAICLTACAPDKYELGDMDLTSGDLVEGIAYSITHDSANPNIIHLNSLLDSKYLALWEHPQGRSQGSEVTLKMPFEGTYSVTFGVETRGGIVYGAPTTFTIDDFCADFVSDDMWTYLSGGVGNSKRWVIDLDENGLSRYFAGPITFYGTDDSWETVTGGTVGTDSSLDSWDWGASWGDVAGWQFPSYAMDYGYMEFDLNGGSNVTSVMNDLDKTMTGTYMLDTDNHTITFTDCELLHDSKNDGQVETWTGTMKLLSLTENYMQIGVLRISDPCILSFNYISEDYRDSWVPAGSGEQIVPELASDWRDYVEPKTSKVMTYGLSEDEPFDWCDLYGNPLGIGGTAGDLEDFSFVLNSGTGEYTLTTPDLDTYTGSFTLSNDGVYTFSEALPTFALSSDGSVVFKTNDDNTLRILSYETSDYTGSLTDLWLGSEIRDDQGNLVQYLGYHFLLQTGGDTGDHFTANMNYFNTGWTFWASDDVDITGDGSYTFTIYGADSDPYGMYLDVFKILKSYPNMDMVITDIKVDGTTIDFDDSVIDRGEGDDSTTARRYILNPWGATADDAPNYVFSTSISVTIQVTMETGTPFGK